VKTEDQIQHFSNIWHGGYLEGEIADPMSWSNYGPLGYMSCLYATYLCCIKPYVREESTVLEIGPGRGAWTKTMLQAKEIQCVDAVPAEQSGFWNYLGNQRNVRYLVAKDFSLKIVPDGHFDYFFSFGTFCHINNAGIREYMRSVFAKLRPGSHGFFMHADFDKYNAALDHKTQLENVRACHGRRYAPIRWLWRIMDGLAGQEQRYYHRAVNRVDEVQPGVVRWHHLANADAVRFMEELGYRVIDADLGTVHRDPVLHFIRP